MFAEVPVDSPEGSGGAEFGTYGAGFGGPVVLILFRFLSFSGHSGHPPLVKRSGWMRTLRFFFGMFMPEIFLKIAVRRQFRHVTRR